MNEEAVRLEIRKLIAEGIYHQDSLFNLLYPYWLGHYARLRDIISEEKEHA